MATDRVDAFLQAEEEAHRLVEQLARLRDETNSYTIARKALHQAAEGVCELANELSELAGQLGTVVTTLRSIGTPELLRAQEAATSELALLRQDLAATQQSATEVFTQTMGEVRALREGLETAECARQEDQQRLESGQEALATAVRNAQKLVIGSLGVSLMALALLGWLVLSLLSG